jgi:hypothetical protein
MDFLKRGRLSDPLCSGCFPGAWELGIVLEKRQPAEALFSGIEERLNRLRHGNPVIRKGQEKLFSSCNPNP